MPRSIRPADPALQGLAVGAHPFIREPCMFIRNHGFRRCGRAGHLAAAAEAGVDGQHAVFAQRRLQQQAAQVAGEHLGRVPLGPLGQVAADLALQGRHQQAVFEFAAALGGSISAEHGIGALKERWLPLARSAAEIALFARIRAAFDPAGTERHRANPHTYADCIQVA